MSNWEPIEISAQIDNLAAAVRPDEKKVERFEKSIKDLFPQ